MQEPAVIFGLTAWAGSIAQSWWQMLRYRKPDEASHVQD